MVQAIRIEFPNRSNAIRQKIRLGLPLVCRLFCILKVHGMRKYFLVPALARKLELAGNSRQEAERIIGDTLGFGPEEFKQFTLADAPISFADDLCIWIPHLAWALNPLWELSKRKEFLASSPFLGVLDKCLCGIGQESCDATEVICKAWKGPSSLDSTGNCGNRSACFVCLLGFGSMKWGRMRAESIS